MGKMKKYHSFSDWKADQSEENKILISSLQKLIKKIAPHLTTFVKWGQGCFLDNEKPVIYIHTEPSYVQLGFYRGSSLQDPLHLLSGKGKYVRAVIIKEKKDINEDAFTALINQVI